MEPVLSVVVATRNVSRWIDECLQSLLDTSPDEVSREIIVVDDDSTDGTWETVGEYAARDPRIRRERSPGSGGGEARNHGVRVARGSVLAFADGDDIVPRRAHSDLVHSLQAHDADVAVGDFLKFDALRTWSITRRRRAYRSLSGGTLPDRPALIRNRACWNRVYRRDFWEAHSIRFPSVPRSNDIVAMTSVLARAERIAVLPRIVYLYRSRPGSTSMTSGAGAEESLVSYLEQEELCARIVATQPDAVRHEYTSMLWSADLWNHLLALFHRRGSLAENMLPELTQRYRRLLVTLGTEPVGPKDRRLVFDLAGRGDWEGARATALASLPAVPDCREDADAGIRWLSAASADSRIAEAGGGRGYARAVLGAMARPDMDRGDRRRLHQAFQQSGWNPPLKVMRSLTAAEAIADRALRESASDLTSSTRRSEPVEIRYGLRGVDVSFAGEGGLTEVVFTIPGDDEHRAVTVRRPVLRSGGRGRVRIGGRRLRRRGRWVAFGVHERGMFVPLEPERIPPVPRLARVMPLRVKRAKSAEREYSLVVERREPLTNAVLRRLLRRFGGWASARGQLIQ